MMCLIVDNWRRYLIKRLLCHPGVLDSMDSEYGKKFLETYYNLPHAASILSWGCIRLLKDAPEV